jgi:hypothetical protein
MFPPELRENQRQSTIPAILEAVPIDAQEHTSARRGHNGTNLKEAMQRRENLNKDRQDIQDGGRIRLLLVFHPAHPATTV